MSHSASSENDSEDESYHDLPFDFTIQDDDLDLNLGESSALNDENGGDDVFDCKSEFVTRSSSLSPRKETEYQRNRDHASNCWDEEPTSCVESNEISRDSLSESYVPCHDLSPDELFATSNPTKTPTQPSFTQSTNQLRTDTPKSTFIPHKGSLKRITHTQNHLESTTSQSMWPVYSIKVDLEPINKCSILDARQEPPDSYSHLLQTHTHHAPSTISTTQQYQILFSRSQYEQCTKLFTLLDTECTSLLGPECIRDFIWRHCPVIRRRDDALFALSSASDNNEGGSSNISSPTFDEVWRVAVQSDHKYQQQNTILTPRLGIEGWMVFTRLLSLVSHYELQRRFASRHLQQMMRHKYTNYGNGSTASVSPRLNPNEVVVLVDNPPAGPPVPVSMRGLMEVESEMAREDKSRILVEGWPYGSLPSMELNLDHAVVKSGCRDDMRIHSLEKRRVEIQPFSTSLEGDFILRYCADSRKDDSKSTVVRRSYADFCWLNEILNTHKRPGHGNLCGRILPPFPSRLGSLSSTSSSQYHGRTKDVSERAVAVAKSGVGMITSVAKSLWGNCIVPVAALGTSPSSPPKIKSHKAKSSSRETYYYSSSGMLHRDEDVPAEMARRVDRYLNYLLENQALSTSFPLSAILTASQSGLESAKQILNDQAKQKRRRKAYQSLTTDGTTSSAYAILSTLLAKKPSSYFNQSDGDDTPWVRTAARAAMSLQFHGMLETAGRESTSAKIQHASLPKFGTTTSNWDDEDTDNAKCVERPSNRQRESVEGDFEAGVISVDEEDTGGYDLLPSPGPSEEHHVLNATNAGSANNVKTQSRFVYGASNRNDDSPTMIYESHTADAVTLGSVKVDSDIDKLKGIIKSVDHILRKLHRSSMRMEASQCKRNALQLDFLKDIDSFGDSRGGVISQRSLVGGVAALENSNILLKRSNRTISDDLGWQSALATSAVGATDEVRDAVVSSRTASRAKAAAFTAAAKSRKTYESLGASSSRDEIKSAQAEASSTQSHAIHATVVEYESNMAKKQAAVSLAQDVKCWNTHRKRQLRQTCFEYAKLQRDAYRKAADAWESLRDGLIESSTPCFAHGELGGLPVQNTPEIRDDHLLITSAIDDRGLQEASRFSLTDVVTNANILGFSSSQDLEGELSEDQAKEENQLSTESINVSSSVASIPEAFVDVTELTASALNLEDSSDNVYLLQPPDISNLDDDHFALQQDIISAADSSSQSEDDEAIDTCAFLHDDLGIESVLDQRPPPEQAEEQFKSSVSGENMTMSMQSLIDGLMTWGGDEEPINDIGYETEGEGKECMKMSSLLE